MQFLDLTLPTLAENLALDEALLEHADSTSSTSEPSLASLPVSSGAPSSTATATVPSGGGETLRVWQAASPCVVLGRSSRVADEVDQVVAAREGIPIFRRVSGGATVIAGPGCLFYALILSLEQRPELRMLDQAHHCVMSRMQTALCDQLPDLISDGTCDLVLKQKKISGNSVRVGREWMLYHGTLLLNMDLSYVDRLLKHPPREPEYRRGRSHLDFIDNCYLAAPAVIEAWRLAWKAVAPAPNIPAANNSAANFPSANIPGALVERLVREKYSQASWNLQR